MLKDFSLLILEISPKLSSILFYVLKYQSWKHRVQNAGGGIVVVHFCLLVFFLQLPNSLRNTKEELVIGRNENPVIFLGP